MEAGDGLPDGRRGEGERAADGRAGGHGSPAADDAALMGATPEYRVTTTEGDEEAHLAAMEEETGAAVALVSAGPSAREKRWRRR